MTSLNRIVKDPEKISWQLLAGDLYQDFKVSEEPAEEAADSEPVIYEEDQVIREARAEAAQIIEDANKAAEELKEAARAEGYEKGEAEGYQAGTEKALLENQSQIEEEMASLRGRIADYVTEVGHAKEELLERYMDDLKNISLAIGEKIVQTSLKSSEKVIERMILAATEKLKHTAWAKIYVGNKNESMDIQGDVQFLQSLSKLADNVKIIMMNDEEIGTCIVELPSEIIDISVGTQLENIREILNNARM